MFQLEYEMIEIKIFDRKFIESKIFISNVAIATLVKIKKNLKPKEM
jgi:hypothetical protein